jgi:putative MATE family efflux protein
MLLFARDKDFYKKVIKFALPIALQSFITVGINMLDTNMVSQVSQDALSATSLSNSFISIYQILCMGLGMGASVLVSRYWGLKKTEKGNTPQTDRALKQTVCLMLRLTIILASVFAILSFFFPALLMNSYSDEERIIFLGVEYFQWSVPTYFFLGASLTTTIVLRSVGQVKFPLFVSIGALGINFLANYAFIFGHFGAPRMEVAGAALGTLISRIFEAGMILGYLFFKDKKILFRIRDLFISTRSLIREYIRICIPVLISDGILAFGNNTVAMVIGHLGGAFTAANAITSVTQQLSTVVIQGVCQAGAIITGQTLGKYGKEKTVKQSWLFLGLGLALGTVSALFIFFASDLIISSYSTTEQARIIAKSLMDSISIIIIFQATNSIMTKGVLRGGGDTKMLMLADNCMLWILSIPLGCLAGFYLHLPAFLIYFFLKIDQVIKTIWCIFRLKSEKWIKKISTGDTAHD